MAGVQQPKVAMSDDFWTSWNNIPKKMQSKVMEFVFKFRSNPTSSAINYEKLVQFRDKTLRSVRIDQTWRGIVKKPDQGNVFMLLWVDVHDKAYDWAKNKICNINPETGSIQIYSVDEIQLAAAEEVVRDSGGGLFAEYHNRHLMKLGVPEDLLPLVRAVRSDSDLDETLPKLPQECRDALYGLAAGYSLDEVLQERNRSAEEESCVDPDDYETALDNPETKSRFVVVEDDIALQEMMEAPLEKWRVFLHPTQRGLVERQWNGPVRVLGGAGTGKTVVAMHRAKYLAERIFIGPHERILFTTFTRNLAADIRENLSRICAPEVMRRIEVVNLDRWVSTFLAKNSYEYTIDYGAKLDDLWQQSLSLVPEEVKLPESFYREEWEGVIQPQGITTLPAYVKASRVGRGVRLSRAERAKVWPVFEEYRVLMSDNNLREIEDAMRDACALIKQKGDVLPYSAVVVDEAQDMGFQAFQLIREIAGVEHKNDIFIVGDAHQRIYRHKVVLGRCGIKIVGRARRLRVNYRTTEENRRWAVQLLKGVAVDDLDGGEDSLKGYTSLLHGVVPEVRNFASFQEEVEHLAGWLKALQERGRKLRDVCLVARTKSRLEQYEKALNAVGVTTCQVRRSEVDDREKEGLRLATMHRVKGLEFERMILAGMNEDAMPLAAGTDSSDSVVQREAETREKALLYVAATRAKREVLVTGFGKMSRFLSGGGNE